MPLPPNFTWPTPAYLFGAIVFGLVGLAALRYGRRSGQARPQWIGVVLMAYPYLVPNTVALYAIGVLLCAALFVARG